MYFLQQARSMILVAFNRYTYTHNNSNKKKIVQEIQYHKTATITAAATKHQTNNMQVKAFTICITN